VDMKLHSATPQQLDGRMGKVFSDWLGWTDEDRVALGMADGPTFLQAAAHNAAETAAQAAATGAPLEMQAMWQALVAKDWHELFVTLRPQWAHAQLVLFGHALMEKLVAPRKGITARNIPIKSALIDSSSTRLQNGADVYVSRIIRDALEEKERASISQAHRKLKEAFGEDENVKLINERITQAARISQKAVSISVDMSSQTAWESSLMTYIDLIPFQYIGKGEQCVIKTKLALSTKKNVEATAILLEEPENHLSHARLNELIADLTAQHGQKQIIISTHSSFVANKLGLDHLIVLREGEVARIPELGASDFFKKLAGYDTLRVALAAKAILVEGDSDELVVQRAYMDANGGRLPIQDGIDVISVGTAFLRFLELADKLRIPVAVVTDNDGDTAAVEKKYAAYKASGHVKICYDPDVDTGSLTIKDKPFNYNTLEPKLLKANDRATLNAILGMSANTDDELLKRMQANKTESALAIFNSSTTINYPDYIKKAIAP
jgi:predicted ATP-dependent endonuclease of OLD family